MHTFGMSVVEIFKLFFCHEVSDPIKNCAGVLPWEMLNYTAFLSVLLTDEDRNG